MSEDEEPTNQKEEITNLCLMANSESSPPKFEVNSEHQFPSTLYYNEHDNVLEEEYNELYINNMILKESS